MLLQLIIKNITFMQFLTNLLLTSIGRAIDLLSTRYITKELKLETNKLARKIGWRGMILLQIPILILGTLDYYLAFFILFWSILLFANNIQGSWYIKEIGENNYQKEIQSHLKKSKSWKIVLSELYSLVSFTLAGVLIIIFIFVFKDLISVFFICLALICQGILGTIRTLQYLIELKREESNGERS